ncbi:hypothetical protein GOP47_0029491 [Adiantum capillus-veneris]|nr:hypothetical protein GOP47_0029491 [Adiantum capillus-veneris]
MAYGLQYLGVYKWEVHLVAAESDSLTAESRVLLRSTPLAGHGGASDDEGGKDLRASAAALSATAGIKEPATILVDV